MVFVKYFDKENIKFGFGIWWLYYRNKIIKITLTEN